MHYIHSTMQQQSLDFAISTADLLSGLDLPADEPKYTFSDFLMSTGQVATALSLCWVLHILV